MYPFTSKLESDPERNKAAPARNRSKIHLETQEQGGLGKAVAGELGLQFGLTVSTPASAVPIHAEVAQNLCGPGTRMDSV